MHRSIIFCALSYEQNRESPNSNAPEEQRTRQWNARSMLF